MYINGVQLLDRLNNLPGLIPIDLDGQNGTILWQDIGAYHPYEGYFTNSVGIASALVERSIRFTTDVSVLEELPNKDTVYPTGFIFHIARCGSTLLLKALSRSRCNLTFSEAPPHNQIWHYFHNKSGDPEVNPQWYRALVLAMARKRVATHENCFIKFTSYNALFIKQVLSAFPDVPAIFLYRDPQETMASILRSGNTWLAHKGKSWGNLMAGVDTADLSDDKFVIEALANIMQAGLAYESPHLHLLDYCHLKAHNFAKIVSTAFDAKFSKSDLESMTREFDYYSKSDFQRQRYLINPSDGHDVGHLVQAVQRNLFPIYNELRQHANNIF